MHTKGSDSLKQLDNLLGSSNQSWLFGAGISKEANIPLMFPLTDRVFAMAETDADKRIKQVLEAVKSELRADSHIEHVLSHLGDFAAIADRSQNQTAKFGTVSLELKDLRELHAKVLGWIAETVRWGYVGKTVSAPERIGTRDNPIVSVDDHLKFVSALFDRNQAGLVERRRAVNLFTTNYDTLLEDALALGCFSYWDGFSGGAVAHRSHRYGQDEPESGFRAHVIKLHGSIDWHLGDDDRVWRVRDGDIYPARSTRVLIHPQSTKYLAAQHDPFASQFDLLRRSLGAASENLLAICGYSFGDDHINQEIELALQRPENKTTILAFCSSINEVLKSWQGRSWGKRLYVITASGLYVGADGPFFPPTATKKRDWWTFTGVANILNNGAEVSVL